MSIQQPTRLGKLVAELLCAASLTICALTLCHPPPARADCRAACDDNAAAATTSGSASGSAAGSSGVGSSGAGSSTIGPNLAGMGLSLVMPVMGFAPRILARMIVPPNDFPSFDNIITNESSWNVFALNPKSGAYGLGQALPPEKMAAYGADWRFNPATQIRWAYTYMCERYGSPDGAWAFWQDHHWY